VPTSYTRALRELRRSDAGEFGGKSANLGELLSAGIAVPPGFAVSASAFLAFVEETGLEGAIASAVGRASSADVTSLESAAKAIGEAMRFAPLPDGIRGELASGYDELARASGTEAPPVAVRSSALGEDSEEASFAGQQESFLWIRGLEPVVDALRDCWVSLYTPRAISYRAISYRAKHGAGGPEPAMGVTVQAMVDAEVSGVLFTCNPVSGDPSMVAIDASWGLGTAVVGGELTPDQYVLSKVTGEVVRQTVGAKEIEYVPDEAAAGTVRREVDADRRDAACLGDAELAALVEIARRVESHYGSHQDVEWAIARGERLPDSIRVLQARPVTTRRQAAPKVSGSALSLVMSTFGAKRKTDES
jgi:phosphoenolpyruvate synthase/pyruvate phosphate dikinase